MKKVTFKINGEQRTFSIEPDEKLLDLLRRSGLRGAKHGCGEGTCGACTVILNGQAVYSCILYAFQADGCEIETIEGVGTFENPHPFQKALAEAGAVQCGFCIPGMVLSAKAMLDEGEQLRSDDVLERMDGNLCRCTGYEKIYEALQKVIAAEGMNVE